MHYYLNRTLCDVLVEMRQTHETRNYSYLPGLIEEAQSMASRMEAALQNQKDYSEIQKQLSKAKKELKALEDKLNEAKD